jgi:hypothetical protein
VVEVGLTDAAGDFLSYTVDVTSVVLFRRNLCDTTNNTLTAGVMAMGMQ